MTFNGIDHPHPSCLMNGGGSSLAPRSRGERNSLRGPPRERKESDAPSWTEHTELEGHSTGMVDFAREQQPIVAESAVTT